MNSGIFETRNLISEIGILKNLFKDGILEIDKWINNNNNSNEMMVK